MSRWVANEHVNVLKISKKLYLDKEIYFPFPTDETGEKAGVYRTCYSIIIFTADVQANYIHWFRTSRLHASYTESTDRNSLHIPFVRRKFRSERFFSRTICL